MGLQGENLATDRCFSSQLGLCCQTEMQYLNFKRSIRICARCSVDTTKIVSQPAPSQGMFGNKHEEIETSMRGAKTKYLRPQIKKSSTWIWIYLK